MKNLNGFKLIVVFLIIVFAGVVNAGNTFIAPEATEASNQPYKQVLTDTKTGEVMHVFTVYAPEGYSLWEAYSRNSAVIKMSFGELQQYFYQIQPNLSLSKDVGRYFEYLPTETWWKIPLNTWHKPVVILEEVVIIENSVSPTLGNTITETSGFTITETGNNSVTNSLKEIAELKSQNSILQNGFNKMLETVAILKSEVSALQNSFMSVEASSNLATGSLKTEVAELKSQISVQQETGNIFSLLNLVIAILFVSIIYVLNITRKLRKTLQEQSKMHGVLYNEYKNRQRQSIVPRISPLEISFETKPAVLRKMQYKIGTVLKYKLPQDLSDVINQKHVYLTVVEFNSNDDNVYVRVPGINDPIALKNVLHAINNNIERIATFFNKRESQAVA